MLTLPRLFIQHSDDVTNDQVCDCHILNQPMQNKGTIVHLFMPLIQSLRSGLALVLECTLAFWTVADGFTRRKKTADPSGAD